MKIFVGLLTLLLALAISGVAGYFSIVGLAALFAAAFWPVIVMGSVLEAGKLTAAGWLHANWRNPNVNALHKAYLCSAVVVLMLITAIGIYGFLAKGHLEQEAPLAVVGLHIEQIEQRIVQTKDQRARLAERERQLDQSVNVLLGTSKSAKEAQAANRSRAAQAKEREQIRKDLAAKDQELNTLAEELLPLKHSINDVTAKLGPIKYVASLFGWHDPNTAVQMVILMIMFAFDPLAVVLLLSATISMSEFFAARRARKAAKPMTETADTPAPEMEDLVCCRDDGKPRGSLVTELPKGEDLGDIADLKYFEDKLNRSLARHKGTPDAKLAAQTAIISDALSAADAGRETEAETAADPAKRALIEQLHSPIVSTWGAGPQFRFGPMLSAQVDIPAPPAPTPAPAPETPPPASEGWLTEPWFPNKQ